MPEVRMKVDKCLIVIACLKMAPRRRASSSSQVAQQSLSLAQHQALIYKRPVVIERVFYLRDFNDLEYEGQSIKSNFEER
ncbi:hypothetical protein CJ030_MR7G009287 [Morella rubra]|uniref:Uncharacterized protein n=1 Tax=Morella rubra TaxID=262757 RepID=A0A6A1V1Z9_9ROSI|nr:hypothetical protein CJ030_MR7G009287 [Morella rubra]